jgi:hypothetical protein
LAKVRAALVLVSILAVAIMTLGACSPAKPTLSASCTPADGGIVSPASATYKRGEVATVTATAAPGYRFDRWEGTEGSTLSSTSAQLELEMHGSQTVIAIFQRVYRLSVSCTPQDAGTVSAEATTYYGGTYDAGRIVTMTARPGKCFKFDGWSGDVSENVDAIAVSMDSDKTIVASFSMVLSGRVWTSAGSYMVGADGKPIILDNNSSASDPSYAQLLTFLKADRTESYPYEPSVYTCGDFAETLHNNAEKAGIRTGYVLCTNHAMNVFQTTDMGLVYIDDTGFELSADGIDKVATIGSDNKVTEAALWPEDQAEHPGLHFHQEVYFKEIVWDGCN